MKFIITESQNNFLWLLRRLHDPEIKDHLTEIVVEGLDLYNPCDYSLDEYVNIIVEGSAETFILSYEDKFTDKENIDSLRQFIKEFIIDNYDTIISKHYDFIINEFDDCD